MVRVDFKVTAIASVTLTALAFISPYAMRLAEASPATPAIRRSLSATVIGEDKVGKKTFITSKIIVKAAPARVWDVLTDYDGAAGIFSNLSKSKLMTSSDHTKLVAFSARALGNLLKFDYTLEVTERHPELIEWRRASGAFQANEGYWKLEPIESGKATLVTYAKHVDGGFLYPQVLVKKLIRDSIPVIFAELKSAAESPSVAKSKP